MATFTEAVHTVEAMAAIPCLRGGFVCFDEELTPVGWYQQQDNLGEIWAEVPNDPAWSERAVRVAIHERREGLEEMIRGFEPGGLLYDSRPTPEDRIDAQLDYGAALCRLVAAVGEVA